MKTLPTALLAILAPPALAAPLDCTVQPSLKVAVTTAVDGILQEVLVSPGERVAEGQVLARLKSEVEAANLAISRARAANRTALQTAEGRREFYENRLDRAQQLFDRKATTAEALERAETEFIIARNELETAQKDLEFAALEVNRAKAVLALKTVRSPFAGTVVQQTLDPGALVANGAIILELANLSTLTVHAFVPVESYPMVMAAAGATVYPQAPFDTPIAAEISLVDSAFDIASGTFGVELTLENRDHRLPSGLRCTLEFEAGN
ncbi:efflux RND transporter periplasmic adaptor subunit [Mangrovicoccus ximenensis]|uniref:efflux RND transporter periplasmic adaptor subunit n=1 Tax=Mangrovicoccus ximenensis TaxID=1911570 RepID=UPI0013752D0E|nr:efflux RND transporter periplasmic adaptor subunit [Mangrovicoccus ximenensis]